MSNKNPESSCLNGVYTIHLQRTLAELLEAGYTKSDAYNMLKQDFTTECQKIQLSWVTDSSDAFSKTIFASTVNPVVPDQPSTSANCTPACSLRSQMNLASPGVGGSANHCAAAAEEVGAR
eukprot:1572398-Rhodomonas_salina.2